MKKLAADETVIVVPVVVNPVEVQAPAVAVPIQISHMQVAVRVAQNAQCVFQATTP